MEVTRKRGTMPTDLEALVELLEDVVAFSLSVVISFGGLPRA